MTIRWKTSCHTHRPTYRSWRAMFERIGDDSKRYKARGITICERWTSFDNFLADMGFRPDGKSLGRIDNDGNYEPDNCRWETQSEQMNNTTASSAITVGDVTHTYAEWSHLSGIPQTLIRQRINRLKWSPADAVTIAPAYGRRVYGSR